MTEILKDLLWICGIGELRLEVANVKPHAIINVSLPDDFYTWEDPCADMVELYEAWPIPDGPLPDLAELDRLVRLGVELFHEGKRLIVHCASGHNRSALLVALIVRETQKLTGPAAVKFIQDRRLYALWNKNFVEYVNQLACPD